MSPTAALPDFPLCPHCSAPLGRDGACEVLCQVPAAMAQLDGAEIETVREWVRTDSYPWCRVMCSEDEHCDACADLQGEAIAAVRYADEYDASEEAEADLLNEDRARQKGGR